jgi:hypothetical protein
MYRSHLAYELPSETRYWKKDIRKDRSVGLINIAVVFSMWYALMFKKVNVIKRLHIVLSVGYDLSLKKHLSIEIETVDDPAYNTTDVMNSV